MKRKLFLFIFIILAMAACKDNNREESLEKPLERSGDVKVAVQDPVTGVMSQPETVKSEDLTNPEELTLEQQFAKSHVNLGISSFEISDYSKGIDAMINGDKMITQEEFDTLAKEAADLVRGSRGISGRITVKYYLVDADGSSIERYKGKF